MAVTGKYFIRRLKLQPSCCYPSRICRCCRLCNLQREHAWHLHSCMPPPGHEKFPTRIPRPSPGLLPRLPLSRVRTRPGQRAGQRLVTVMVWSARTAARMISPIVLYLLLITENLPLQQDRAESPGCDDCDKCDNGNPASKTKRFK